MIPKFLSLVDHPSSKVRSHAVACLSCFVPTNCQSLFVHIDSFIVCLFRKASDDDPSVRRYVCQALILLLQAQSAVSTAESAVSALRSIPISIGEEGISYFVSLCMSVTTMVPMDIVYVCCIWSIWSKGFIRHDYKGGGSKLFNSGLVSNLITSHHEFPRLIASLQYQFSLTQRI